MLISAISSILEVLVISFFLGVVYGIIFIVLSIFITEIILEGILRNVLEKLKNIKDGILPHIELI